MIKSLIEMAYIFEQQENEKKLRYSYVNIPKIIKCGLYGNGIDLATR